MTSMEILATTAAVCSAFTAGIGLGWLVWLAKLRPHDREQLEGLIRQQGQRAADAAHHSGNIAAKVAEEYMSLASIITGRDPMDAETWPAVFRHAGVQQGDTYSHGMALKEVGTVTQALQDAKIEHRFQHTYHDDHGECSSWEVHVRPHDLDDAERIVKSAMQGQRDAMDRLRQASTSKATAAAENLIDDGVHQIDTEGNDPLAPVYEQARRPELPPGRPPLPCSDLTPIADDFVDLEEETPAPSSDSPPLPEWPTECFVCEAIKPRSEMRLVPQTVGDDAALGITYPHVPICRMCYPAAPPNAELRQREPGDRASFAAAADRFRAQASAEFGNTARPINEALMLQVYRELGQGVPQPPEPIMTNPALERAAIARWLRSKGDQTPTERARMLNHDPDKNEALATAVEAVPSIPLFGVMLEDGDPLPSVHGCVVTVKEVRRLTEAQGELRFGEEAPKGPPQHARVQIVWGDEDDDRGHVKECVAVFVAGSLCTFDEPRVMAFLDERNFWDRVNVFAQGNPGPYTDMLLSSMPELIQAMGIVRGDPPAGSVGLVVRDLRMILVVGELLASAALYFVVRYADQGQVPCYVVWLDPEHAETAMNLLSAHKIVYEIPTT